MSWYCLADFLEELGQAGELARVAVAVDPVLEVAEITKRTFRRGGPALLFGRPQGSEFPVLTNLLGTEGRVCRALGVQSLDELLARIGELVEPSEPEGWFERITTAPTRTALKKVAPRTVKTGPCQQVVRLGGDVDLAQLPALRCRPEETGRTITAGQLFAPEVDSGRTSVGRHDLCVLNRNRLAACWHAHDDPARLLAAHRQRSERMPLAIALGGHPAGLLAAMAMLPSDADASALAGLLTGKARELVKCRTVELHVPTDAEIIIEGYVDPAEPPVDPGPLGTTGAHYRLAQPAPVIHVTALTHRVNAILPAMVPGGPPDEACVIHRALQRVFLPLMKRAIPELVDYDLPTFGAARLWAFLSIRKQYAGQARKVAHAAWALRPLMFAKMLVMVDDDVDVHDHRQVWSAIATHVDPGRDVFFADGPPDPLDSASPPGSLGRRMAVDATAKLPGEHPGEPPQPARMTEEVCRLVSARWSEYGLGPEPGGGS